MSNNESLQLVYLDCIQECLEALEVFSASVAEGSQGDDSGSQCESDNTSSFVAVVSVSESCEKAVSMVYTLLSSIEAQPGMMKLTKKIDTLFHVLLKASYPFLSSRTSEASSGPSMMTFDPSQIYACLLGSNGFLISRLHEVEVFLWINGVSDDPLPSSYPLFNQRASNMASTFTDARKGVEEEEEEEEATKCVGVPPHRSCMNEEWKDRFYAAMFNHKHLLESVLERGLQLICTGKLQELSPLMLKAEFIPLRPVLLLLGWDRYLAAGSGKELLDVLWPMEVSGRMDMCACAVCMCCATQSDHCGSLEPVERPDHFRVQCMCLTTHCYSLLEVDW